MSQAAFLMDVPDAPYSALGGLSPEKFMGDNTDREPNMPVALTTGSVALYLGQGQACQKCTLTKVSHFADCQRWSAYLND